MLNFLFFIFATILVVSCFSVTTTQNSIYAVLFLVLGFLSGSFLLILLDCELLALLLTIIYVGALAILFLFAVMMLNIKLTADSPIKYFPFGSFVGSLFLLEVLSVVFTSFKSNPYQNSFLYNEYQNWHIRIDSISEIDVLSQVLYTHYVLQFLVVGLILFLVAINVTILTINYRSKKFSIS
jgi:NADH-quinone oxidoreductase subunit J